MGAYDLEDKKSSFPLALLTFFGRYRIKVGYGLKEKETELEANPIEKLFSIFYAYEDYEKNFFMQSLLGDIEIVLENATQLIKNSVTIVGNVNNFISINIDNQNKRIIRTITKSSFLSVYHGYKSTPYDCIEKVDRLCLNHLIYSNFKIIRNDFESSGPYDWIAEVMKSPKYLENDYWHDLVLILANFYDDGYTIIRTIVPYVAFDRIETFPNSYLSLYLQCNLIEKSKNIAIKYSYPNNSLRDYAVGAVHAYLSHFKNFDNMYKGESDFTYIFKMGQKTSIDDNFIKSNYLEYFRYNLIIDMYNANDSKSYLYNLFILCFNDYDNIAFVIDQNNRSFDINTLQIILPYNKGKEYKLFENHIFHDRAHMKNIIEQIISNSVILIRAIPRPIAFIVPKE